MDSISTLLKNKAKQINLDQKQEDLEVVKSELLRFMTTQQAKVTSVSEKTVSVRVRSSVIASELRMRQYNLTKAVTKALDREITRIYIKTG